MNCLTCGHRNPGTVAYCQKCGGKMDFTADEISASLVEKKKGEVVANTEFYAKQSLLLGAILFLVAMTLFVLSTGAPKEGYAVPSVSNGAKYLEIDAKADITLPRMAIPLEVRKK
jgi:hypothetical protein